MSLLHTVRITVGCVQALAPAGVAWAETSEYLPALKVPRLTGVLPDTTADQSGQDDDALRRAISQSNREMAQAVIAEGVTELVADILHTHPNGSTPPAPSAISASTH
ncbi:hypothetical protein [Herbidospora cretacea]|uniref:hypothetical protein n=1 Tax=Herbidospora cretacea TaxID=28444 RepID=UPI00068AB005|nr:hypothetical protein [Herbidospora cretacea]